MTHAEKRWRFTQSLIILIQYVELRFGYRVVVDFVKRCETCPVGRSQSVHKIGLAADLNFYDQNWNYLDSGLEHIEAHDLWDLLGGAPRIENDMNHYSFKDGGRW